MMHAPDAEAPTASPMRHAPARHGAWRFDEATESWATAMCAYPGHFDAHRPAGIIKIDQGDPVPLDAKRWAGHLDEASATMHKTWRRGMPPQSFAVPTS